MRVYLDTCVLSRLTDSRGDARTRAEALAVERIMVQIALNRIDWMLSSVLVSELLQISNRQKRNLALELLTFGPLPYVPTLAAKQRAAYYGTLGYGRVDALHLACAESMQADVLLTTDDRFLRRIARNIGAPKVAAANPVDWQREVLDDAD